MRSLTSLFFVFVLCGLVPPAAAAERVGEAIVLRVLALPVAGRHLRPPSFPSYLALGVAINGFEGGQMPLHMRMPKRGFNNPFAKEFAEVNLWRLEQAIAAGKLDAKKPIDGKVLVAAGVLRRERDGVRLLAKGELTTKIDITVYSASAAAKAAVEKAGGKITTTAPVVAEAAE